MSKDLFLCFKTNKQKKPLKNLKDDDFILKDINDLCQKVIIPIINLEFMLEMEIQSWYH